MDRAYRPVSFLDVQEAGASLVQFYLLRLGDRVHALYRESPRSPARERRFFGHQGVMIAPWESRMPAADAALHQGRVVDTESPFRITGRCRHARAGCKF